MATSPDDSGSLPNPGAPLAGAGGVDAQIGAGPRDGGVANQGRPGYVSDGVKDLPTPLRTPTIAVTPPAPDASRTDASPVPVVASLVASLVAASRLGPSVDPSAATP